MTSPDKSTLLIFLLNDLRFSAVLRFLGSLDKMRGTKYFTECLPYQTVSNLGSSKYSSKYIVIKLQLK